MASLLETVQTASVAKQNQQSVRTDRKIQFSYAALAFAVVICADPVSYTHLDVYKRQSIRRKSSAN